MPEPYSDVAPGAEYARRGLLVIETSKWSKDPDRIGWMLGEGLAAYREDGAGERRLVQDVLPVDPRANCPSTQGETVAFQRWENATFAELDPAGAYAAFRREGCSRWRAWRLARIARRGFAAARAARVRPF